LLIDPSSSSSSVFFFNPLATFSFSHTGRDVELLIRKSTNPAGKQYLLYPKTMRKVLIFD
jgi:hypothetical protein